MPTPIAMSRYRKGGLARAGNMTARERSLSALKAICTRWHGKAAAEVEVEFARNHPTTPKPKPSKTALKKRKAAQKDGSRAL